MYNLFNSINNNLQKLVLPVDNKPKFSFIEIFLHELQSKLWYFDCIQKLNTLSKDTILYLNDVDANYIDCRKLNNSNMDERFYVPRNLFAVEVIQKNFGFYGTCFKLGNDNLYHFHE